MSVVCSPLSVDFKKRLSIDGLFLLRLILYLQMLKLKNIFYEKVFCFIGCCDILDVMW